MEVQVYSAVSLAFSFQGDSLDGLDKRGLFLRTSRDPAKSDYHGGQMRHVVRPLNNDLSWPEEKLSNGRRDKWGLYVRTLREPVRRHQGPGRGRQGVFLRASRGFNDVENQDWESLGESFLDQDEAEVGHAEQKKADRGLFLRTSKAPVAPYSIEDQAEQRSSMNVLDEEDQEGVDLEQPELDLDTLIAYLAQPAVSVPYMKKADNGLFLRTSRTLGVPWDDTVSMGMTDMDGEAEHPSPSKAKRGLLSRASRTSRHYDKKGDNGLFLRTSRTRGTPWVSGSKRGLFLRTS